LDIERKGTAAHLLKQTSKRKRTKIEMDQAKQQEITNQEAIRNIQMQNNLLIEQNEQLRA